jgi:penicillin-binding protein 1C
VKQFYFEMKKFINGIKNKNRVLFCVSACVSFCLIVCVGFYLYIAYIIPLPDVLKDIGNTPTSKIYDRNGVLLYEILKPELGKSSFVPIEQIPKKFIDATLSAEDINYYSHPGVDPSAIFRAVLLNIGEQRIVSGASTITQQLVRNMAGLGGGNRGFADKVLEAFYSVRISHAYGKDEILELYLNRIYYGNLSYGAQTAALNYFGKNIYDLDLAQISFLAGLPQSPSAYNPYSNFERAKKRQKYVLDRMKENGFISDTDVESAYAESLRLRSNKINIKAPHFVQSVIAQIEEKYGDDFLIKGGINVTTTLDYNLQLKAEKTVENHVQFLSRNNVSNGALISLDVKNGQILAYVGSADFFNKEINGAIDMVTALRQPGSSIKPLTYLLAFERGYTPATVIYDIPTQFNTATGPYSPKNYDLDYHGPVRARIALASSYNIPAVKTLEYVGVENFIGFLLKLGINTLDQPADFYGLALTLGGGEVRMLDMANAFNVIANFGLKKESYSILQIKNGGDVIYDLSTTGRAADNYILGPQGREHAYQIIDILKDPIARIAGFGEQSVLEISRPAAVKTGTTRNFRDNWTIGFTPQLLTAAWVGNADATPMQNISGVDGAAPIWADFMESALANLPKEVFGRPQNLVDVSICAISGKLATEYCPDKIDELFVKGTEPKDYDDYYRTYTFDESTGYAITKECLDEYKTHSNLTQKVILTYPVELLKWAVQKGYKPPLIYSCKQSGYTNGYTDAYSNGEAGAGLVDDGAINEGATNEGSEGENEVGEDGLGVNNNGGGIQIDNPVNNDVYSLESSLPTDSQKIAFRVTVPLNTKAVKYFVDGEPAATVTEFPFTYLWPPAVGHHTMRAETDGSYAGVSFDVNR